MYSAVKGMRANSSSSIHAAPPIAIGRYRLLTRIASGGMGAVFLAETDWVPGSPPQRVALKVLHSHHGDDEEITSRFVDEGRVAGRIVHANVVQVLDAGRTDEYAYMALEYVHGDTLSALLRACSARGAPFPLGIVSAIAIDFLEGLHAAHGATDDAGTSIGLVHRDVSPQNILVGVNGRAYVTDFGVAKVKDRIRATRSGSMIGKTGYMAPEQVAGGVVSAKTDLYAAGIVLWECLAGAKLFDGLEAQIQAAVTRKPPPAVRSRRPEVPEAIDQLVADLLQHAPDRRPESAHAVAARVGAAIPRASQEEVAAWVTEIVRGKLEERERRVQASLHAGLGGEGPAEPSSETSDLARLPSDGVETKADEAVAAPLRPGKRRTWVAAAAAATLVVGLVGSIVGFAHGPDYRAAANLRLDKIAHRDTGTAELPPIPALPAPPPAASSSAPVASSAAAKPAKPVVANAAPRERAPAKPVKPAGAACSPPYVVENGIKRYKAECFGGGKQ